MEQEEEYLCECEYCSFEGDYEKCWVLIRIKELKNRIKELENE